eukprot:Ihof_evm6s35 gene=Ihof_evmTU6s35
MLKMSKSMMQAAGTGSKYFTTTKKGEIFELKAELASEKRDKKKDAVKKVIANMTVGKDVSALFPDVVNCMQTADLELKKLVYLYLMNYAKTQPDMAILAVNTFQKDCSDPSPLIRSLAVRTMGCIRVDKITEYLCDPLRKCLKDEDPYVRKTAAVCIAKLYDMNPELVEEQGFLETLRDLLSDPNPMVVANAVAALSEINEVSEEDVMLVNSGTLNKLLTALNECTEWGQVFILDSLATIEPKDSREAQSICERVIPRLQHANSAVVLSAIKVLMKYMAYVEDRDFLTQLQRKLAPPLVTLMSVEPEVQYVALRNINLIIQKRPMILKHEMKVFFVKYNDPIYVKLEKLDIIIRLASEINISQVLAELKEYATGVDVEFVRKSVRAIGRCAIKIESASERCIHTLVDLIQTKVNYVVQEAIVVIKDIFRKYPNRYESIIGRLCENLETLDEPEAKASMIWIIGEYATLIDNANEILEEFLDAFMDEGTQVQLQILTAIVKLFLKKPNGTQDLVQRVLTLATHDVENADLRDRGYIYWRLLSTDPAAAKAVVLAEKPLINEESDCIESGLLDELIGSIASLASVFYKPASAFSEQRISGARLTAPRSPDLNGNQGGYLSDRSRSPSPDRSESVMSDRNSANAQPPVNDIMGDLLGLDLGPSSTPTSGMNQSYNPPTAMGTMDLLGLDLDPVSATSNNPVLGAMSGTSMMGATNNMQPAMGGGLDDIFGMGPSSSSTAAGSSSSYVPLKELWLSAQKAKGLEVSGSFSLNQGQLQMNLTLTNKAMQPLTGFALQLNKNSFGVSMSSPLSVPGPLAANQSFDVSIPLNTNGAVQRMDPLNNLQVALKNNVDVFYFSCLVPVHCFFVKDGRLAQNQYVQLWGQDLPAANERQFNITTDLSLDQVESRLEANHVFLVAKQN